MRRRYCFILFVFAISALFLFTTGCKKKQVDFKVKIALGGQQPTAIDPTTFASGDPINGMVFDNLVMFNTDSEITPMLAVSWEYANGGKDLVMKLRKDVKFSTGTPFTAKDVVFSIERNRKTNFAIEDQLRTGYIGAEAVDDYTVKFKFENPNAQFLYQTCAMMYIISEEEFKKAGEKAFAQNPIGTGQYKFSGWQAGNYIDLVENEFYWGDKPQIKEARILLTPDPNTRLSMLKAGEVQFITNVPWKSVSELESAGFNVTKVEAPHAQALTFALFNKNTPWANLKVRQAINYAIDKKAIIEKLFDNVPVELQWQYPWELGYDSSLKPAYPYDPQKAKQLMEEAGYADGFEMPLLMLADVVGLKDITDYLTNSLKQINISCKVNVMNFGPEFFGFMRKVHEDPNASTVVFWEIGGPGNPDPVINLTNQYYSKKPSGLYSTPELDAVIDQALQTVNTKERAKLIKKAYQMVDKELPLIHILGAVYVYAGQENVTYEPQTSMMNNAYNMLKGITIK